MDCHGGCSKQYDNRILVFVLAELDTVDSR
jgi:hypothetical protein